MIQIKNIGSSTVTIICPDFKFRRKLPLGREIPVAKEIYDELCYDTGFQSMVKFGMLKVSGAEIEDAEVIETDYTVLSADGIKEIFETKDITKFAKIIPNAAPATKDSIVKLATEMRIVDAGFVALINKYCNVNVMDAISAQAEE